MNYNDLTHSQAIGRLKAYFKITELVDETTYKAHGERAFKFFDTKLLISMLFIRETLGKGITVNNWTNGGPFSQRGLRTNVCDIVKKKTNKDRLYLSAHVLGQGIDFDVKGMTADQVREWLQSVADQLPFKIRLEHKINKTGKTITWVHLDTFDEDKNGKIYLFNI